MLLFETKLFKAVYFDAISTVHILMSTPDVKDSWKLTQEIKADNYDNAMFAAKSYVLNLVLDTVNTIK